MPYKKNIFEVVVDHETLITPGNDPAQINIWTFCDGWKVKEFFGDYYRISPDGKEEWIYLNECDDLRVMCVKAFGDACYALHMWNMHGDD